MRLFSAEWCPYCKKVKRIAQKYDWDLEVVDIDEQVQLAMDVAPTQLPALQLDNGDLMYESSDIIKYLKATLNV